MGPLKSPLGKIKSGSSSSLVRRQRHDGDEVQDEVGLLMISKRVRKGCDRLQCFFIHLQNAWSPTCYLLSPHGARPAHPPSISISIQQRHDTPRLHGRSRSRSTPSILSLTLDYPTQSPPSRIPTDISIQYRLCCDSLRDGCGRERCRRWCC